MTVEVSGVHHLTLRVTDLEASRRFYEGVQEMPGGGHLVVCRDPDNVQVEFVSNT